MDKKAYLDEVYQTAHADEIDKIAKEKDRVEAGMTNAAIGAGLGFGGATTATILSDLIYGNEFGSKKGLLHKGTLKAAGKFGLLAGGTLGAAGLAKGLIAP